MTLHDLRTTLGLTQEAMARRIGCSISTYRQWEQGSSTPTAQAYKLRIAQLTKGAQKEANDGKAG